MRKITRPTLFLTFSLSLLLHSFILPSVEAQQGRPTAGQQTLTNSIGMRFVSIPAGTFAMGLKTDYRSGSSGRIIKKPPHRVRISQPYYLQSTVVTQSQWKSVMGTEPWKGQDNVEEGPNYPATYVSWDDAVAFCEKLSQQEGKTYRLPTEAEWEYACRAGTTTEYSFGDEADKLVQYAWYSENTVEIGEAYAHEVGRKKPNAWGLYDMHGNVWEWCSDWYDERMTAFTARRTSDPQGPPEGSHRVTRGGSWNNNDCRSSYRGRHEPSSRYYGLGFRLALSPSPDSLCDNSVQPIVELQTFTNSIGMKLVLIPKGTFLMGSPQSEEGSEANERQHEVTLSRDYFLGAFEVTQAQYQKVMGKNPSYFQGNEVAKRDPQTGQVVKEVDSSNHPVEQVSWEDAVEFCKRLSELPAEKKAGREYRLPTEAEWEYACRAGSKTAYSFEERADYLGDYGWFEGNSDHQTHPVGEKKPNAWGVYDMHGNVYEWCSDWYGDYPKGSVGDPVGSREGSKRVVRGGGYFSSAGGCRSALRNWNDPSSHSTSRSNLLGFRVALSPSENPQ